MHTTGVALSYLTAYEAVRRTGALPRSIRPLHPAMHITAPAFPVKSPPGDNLWLHHAIKAALPGEVLVVETSGEVEYAYWDEDLADAAIARRLAGLVIHGGVRDAERLVEKGWPVFAECISLREAGKDPEGGGDLGEPVTVGDVEVCLGDWVIADADGIVCVPAARARGIR